MPEWLIGEYLVVKGLITRPQLKEALKAQREKGGFLGDVLVKFGYTTEEKIVSSLSRQLRIPYVDLKTFIFKPEVVKLIPEDLSLHHNIIALCKIEGVITVAMSDPLDLALIRKISQVTNCEVQTVFATRSDISDAISKSYDGKKTTEVLESFKSPIGDLQTKEEIKMAVDSDIESMMTLLDSIVKDIGRLRSYLARVIKT
ncbi:MAG: hypothetical protein ABIG56_00780 [Candidatus Omnitrophota bacterium]